jgi:hypothetical protein
MTRYHPFILWLFNVSLMPGMNCKKKKKKKKKKSSLLPYISTTKALPLFLFPFLSEFSFLRVGFDLRNIKSMMLFPQIVLTIIVITTSLFTQRIFISYRRSYFRSAEAVYDEHVKSNYHSTNFPYTLHPVRVHFPRTFNTKEYSLSKLF